MQHWFLITQRWSRVPKWVQGGRQTVHINENDTVIHVLECAQAPKSCAPICIKLDVGILLPMKKPETCQVVQSSFMSNYHGTGPFSNPLLSYWEECWGPCSPMHTVPASSSCSSATPDLSSSHTEWMEPPEECGHKRRNVIFAECYHPSTTQCTHATNGYVCPQTHTHTHRSTRQAWAW